MRAETSGKHFAAIETEKCTAADMAQLAFQTDAGLVSRLNVADQSRS